MISAEHKEHLTREARRRRTEATILAAARESFAEVGFERATIRLVAKRAGVDPALVMQYYGNKEALFAAAARRERADEQVWNVARADVAAAALADLREQFERDGNRREAAVALMRNCLTHPEAARIMRDDVMCERVEALATTLGGDDAALRAGLVGACVMGVAMARYLLDVHPVSAAGWEEIEALMLPALTSIVEGANADGE